MKNDNRKIVEGAVFAKIADDSRVKTLDQMIKLCEKAKKAQKNGEWKEMWITLCNEKDGYVYAAILGDRSETDIEMVKRLNKEKKKNKNEKATLR